MLVFGKTNCDPFFQIEDFFMQEGSPKSALS